MIDDHIIIIGWRGSWVHSLEMALLTADGGLHLIMSVYCMCAFVSV